ncbi:MAG: adenosylcobalamin-dependent ribonucleoside-diphosphate reductase [Caldilineae bacterium]|nr:adenosylcobalamin-dependent ribonucleoside-diphosphate reductase [Chloroflexota bacterium]MCB9175875.1 adenosylcobalamin-dependent ribonucleoside-diphosphate reductase [Caldilineae bacterium]
MRAPIEGRRVAPGDANALNALGEKIFLDRYALKDMDRSHITVGDTVVVCVNTETGQREVGRVERVDGGEVQVRLSEDELVSRAIEHVDRPLEIHPDQMQARVARGIAAVEDEALRPDWEDRFRWLLEGWKFVPGGRILAGAGSGHELTFYNCYVVPSPKDSRDGIIETLSNMTEIMSRGGGVGINLSSLRPRYAPVRGVNGRSSGSVSWGSLYSFVTGLIEQGGSRRGALMLILNVWHPDVLEFIRAKTEAGRITNANISVGITDAFMEAVKADADWDLVFPDTGHPDFETEWNGDLAGWQAAGRPVIHHKTVRAREMWDTIVESAWASAEPGLWFIDRANKMSNSWYYAPLVCTNPCGEQPLPGWSVCNLGALNLSRFGAEGGKVAWEDLGKAVRYAVRFLDNVIDATPYFFETNRDQQLSERRVGLGTMGLAELMIHCGVRYGSPEGNAFLDELYGFIAAESYLASADNAAEKGSFPRFNAEKHLQSGFVRGMPDRVRRAVAEKGIRNVTLLTQAPTGTTGTMVSTSTGIEPFFSWTYYRKSRLGWHEEKVEVLADWEKANPGAERPDYFVTSMELAPEDHVGVQAAIQRWVDSSISKTCNVPNEYTVEETRALYELMWSSGCKGGTVYRDGSRDEQVLHLTDESKDGAKTQDAGAAAPAAPARPTTDELAMAASAMSAQVQSRPRLLLGSTHRMVTPVGKAYVTVNRGEDGDPFEVFVNLGKAGSDLAADAEALGRLISLILRMPSPLDVEERMANIISNLDGIGGSRSIGFGMDRIRSLPDGIARALEQDQHGARDAAPSAGLGLKAGGENPQLLPGADLCPVCGHAAFMHIEGCHKCFSCGHSEC